MRNIVLLTYDSLRADHCGHHGYERPTTPNLDDIAEEGVVFENAVSVASRTNPSMAATFTGEPMSFEGPVSNPAVSRYHLERYGTLAEQLSEMGYTTGAFCPNAYASRYYGFDRGFDHFEDFMFSEDTYQSLFEKHLDDSGIYGTLRNLRNFIRREEVFRTWDRYVDQMEAWADRQDGPYFLWVFALGTHFPFLTPRSDRQFSNLFDQYYYNWKCNQVIDELDPDLSPRTWQKMIDIYDDSIQFADKLIPELQSRLTGDDPVMMVHSDHGEAFGEHDMFGHFYPAMYEENVHVPMVAWEEDGPSETVTEPFSLLDVPEYVTAATEGDIASPPTSEYALMSDYDGRRDRNLVGVRSENRKYLLEQSPDGETGRHFTLTATDDGRRERASDDGPAVLRDIAVRRSQHETELRLIRGASEGLAGDDGQV